MYRRISSSSHRALLFMAALLLMIPAMASSQEPAAALPMPSLERLEELAAEIDAVSARAERAEGADRQLYEELIRRRSAALREELREVVEPLAAQEEASEELDEARSRVEELLLDQQGAIREWLSADDLAIAALREELPSADAARELEIEDSLTQLNDRVDALLSDLLGISELLELLGLDPSWPALDERLLNRAEINTVRMQKALDDLSTAERRLASVAESDRAALDTHLAALREKVRGTTGTIEHVVELLERRGLETAEYREVLLEATGRLTVQSLDGEVALTFVQRMATRARATLVQSGPTIVLRILLLALILALTWFVSRLARRLLRRVLQTRKGSSQLLERFLVRTTGNVILALGLLLGLSQIGIEVAPLLAGLGVAGLVLGLALQDTLSNLFSGLMILVLRPYDIGDVVDAGGVSGTVSQMNLVTTTILTPDNKRLVLPNNRIWGDTIQNVTAEQLRRVDLEFGAGYDDDIDRVGQLLRQILEEHELVLEEPAPNVRVHRLDDSAVTFIVRPWVRTENYWKVYWDLHEEVKRRFDAEGISIPFPQQDVHVQSLPAAALPAENAESDT